MIDLKKYIGYHSPGYVIEIYKDGIETEIIAGNKEVYPKKEKTTKDTLYDIASLTKTFTATLIYIAYEEKKIDINDTVYNLEKKFKNLKQVKIIDLLSHNQNIWTDGYLGNAKSKEEFYNIIYSAYVKENIETYVDVHYMILSTILEKIYKKPFQQICKEKIFIPLNLKDATFSPNPKKCASNNYEQTSNTIIQDIKLGIPHDTKARAAQKLGISLGHASLFITGKDLLTFLKSFLNNKLLKKETIKTMLNHRNTNEINIQKLKRKENDFQKTYNNMGARYRNVIKSLNDIPSKASDNSVTFSGYTGPMYLVDFDKKIIVIIMCNVIHTAHLERKKRKEITEEIMNMIFNKIL